MALGTRAGLGTRLRLARSAGVLPLVAGISSALALTGAAVFTVEQAACGDAGQYVRHANHVELIGGCVDSGELPATEPADRGTADQGRGGAKHSSYMP